MGSDGAVQSILRVATFVLCLAVAGGTGYLIVKLEKLGNPVTADAVRDARKLSQIVDQYHEEFTRVVTEANYPEEDDKKKAKNSALDRTLRYHLSRLAFHDFEADPTIVRLTYFVQLGASLVSTPEYLFRSYDLRKGRNVNFANVSKLESLEEQYLILASSLLQKLQED